MKATIKFEVSPSSYDFDGVQSFLSIEAGGYCTWNGSRITGDTLEITESGTLYLAENQCVSGVNIVFALSKEPTDNTINLTDSETLIVTYTLSQVEGFVPDYANEGTTYTITLQETATPPYKFTRLYIGETVATNTANGVVLKKLSYEPYEESTPDLQGVLNSNIATLPTAAYNMGTAAVGNKVYTFGGRYDDGTVIRIRELDTETNTLTTLSTNLPTELCEMGTAAVGTKIYLFGGCDYEGSRLSDGYTNKATIQVFDTETNAISTLSTTLPTILCGMGTATVGTKIYLFGGTKKTSSISTSQEVSSIQVFDTETNTISTLSTTLPTAAHSMGTAVVGTKIYLFGGRTDVTEYFNTIQVFDTETNAISTLSTTLPSIGFSMGTATVGTKIYLFGGFYQAGQLSLIQVFDTKTNTLSTLSATLPTAAYGIGTAAVGNKVYLFGGDTNGSGALNGVHQFV